MATRWCGNEPEPGSLPLASRPARDLCPRRSRKAYRPDRDHDQPPPLPGSRWARAAVRLAIALAFADASVAVLALPQIVVRLHTSISHVTWVITAYNLALIAGTLAVLPVAQRAGLPPGAGRRAGRVRARLTRLGRGRTA